MSPMVKTRVIPAINGGQGLNPVSIPVKNGTPFINFFIVHCDLSLLLDLKPIIPQIINRIARNNFDSISKYVIKGNFIPRSENSILIARYATNLPNKKKEKSEMGVI